MKKILISFFVIVIFVVGAFSISLALPKAPGIQAIDKKPLVQDFDPIDPVALDSGYISYTEFRTVVVPNATDADDLVTDLGSRIIRFDTADELYRFSLDVIYNPDIYYISANPAENVKLPESYILKILSFDYVLGRDIDYSVQKGKQFVPIGFNFELEETPHIGTFTGTFDGQGFEISNLYVAGLDYLIVEEGEGAAAVDVAVSPYYAMFNYVGSGGEIKNIGLINPTFELLDENEDIRKAANLVGENNGTVENVYVVDNRTNPYDAGIRMKATGGTLLNRYTAAGVLHINNGTFNNALFAGVIVVNASYVSNFLVQPVVYTNNNPTADDDLVYDSTIYLPSSTFLVTDVDPSLATGEETTTIRTGTNQTTLELSLLNNGNWHFYANDRYPVFYELVYNTDHYEIATAKDLIVFSKLLNFTTVKNQKLFRNADYVITNHINMSTFAPGAYVTPSVEFLGTLDGTNGTGNYYISHLALINGVVYSGNYYSGLFSVLSGEVSNITFSSFSIAIDNSENLYSNQFLIGAIAGSVEGGIISDVSAEVDIDLGTKTIGKSSTGGIVGLASGVINNVYTIGTIDGGLHTFKASSPINSIFMFGGVVGSTGDSKLTMNNILSDVDIFSIRNTAELTTPNTTTEIRAGGVIGSITNTALVKHQFELMSYDGTLTANDFISSITVNHSFGGIFGYATGNAFTLSNDFGNWENRGNIESSTLGANNKVRAAGVGVTNHSEQAEYIFVYNKGSFSATDATRFTYTSLIYDMSSYGLVLSQSKNEANHTLTINFADFSGVFYNELNASSELRFVENSGNIVMNNMTLTQETRIAGISTSQNINYLNTYFSGEIRITTITSSYPIWIAGIAYIVSEGKAILNALNEGEIIFAGVDNSANNYIAGITNINRGGTLHTQDDSNTPKTTLGVINSINYARISSTYDPEVGSTIFGLTGNGNTYVGGLVTFNEYSIQDSANLGDINFTHLSDIDSAYIQAYTESHNAGRIYSFVGGITLGGVSALATAGTSRIFDAVNSGNIMGVAKNYVRTGGILAVALYTEIQAGMDTNEANPPILVSIDGVLTSIVLNTIQNSILSNCLNYGNVTAFTQTIAEYNSTPYTVNQTFYTYSNSRRSSTSYRIITTVGTNDRPVIYSCAGGIIGYGLSVMRRMLNHGNITATDVAGGIVGATYVLGAESGNEYTYVNIDTAIHYGSVQAIRLDVDTDSDEIPDSFEYAIEQDRLTFDDLYTNNHIYPHNNEFIFPNTADDITRYPEAKRGFGGVFGRLQRGTNGYMTSNDSTDGLIIGNFDFIVNTDINVDLIGRLDQVYDFTSSARFFIFTNCIYYSARQNDTTQAVFTGFRFFRNRNGYTETTNYNLTYTKRRVSYYLVPGSTNYYRIKTEYYATSGTITRTTAGNYREKVGDTWYPSSSTYYTATKVETKNITQDNYVAVTYVTQTSVPSGYSTTPVVTTYGSPQTLNTNVVINSASTYTVIGNIPIRIITEDDTEPGEYIYDENFEMRDDATTLSNGEPITSYIFYVDPRILSERFQLTRPNGMYVLSTSAGSANGSVLPANMNVVSIYRIAGTLPYDTDYTAISLTDREKNEELVADYALLYQSQYNDKALLLETDQEIILEEMAGGPELHVMVSQAYGGGGNSGSTLKNDFVELFNSTSDSVNLSGWRLFYASPTGSFSSLNSIELTGTIAPRSFYLIKLASGGGGSVDLPTADLNATVDLNETGFKLVLTNTSDVPSNPTSTNVVDFVGAGSADQYETAAAPAPSNTAAIVRNNLLDTDDNSIDFITTISITPRNSATARIPAGSETTLINPIINYVAQTITFEISLEAIASTQTEIYYHMTNVVISEKALAAARIEDYQNGAYVGLEDDFRHELLKEKDAMIATGVKPYFYIDFTALSSENQTRLDNGLDTLPISIGYFTIYSESAMNNTTLMEVPYQNDYQIYLVLKPNLSQSGGSISITNVNIDDVNQNLGTFSTVPVNTFIRFDFTDTAGLLVDGYSIEPFVSLYYGATLVSTYYYTLTVSTVDGGLFSVQFNMSDDLVTGTYTFQYKIFFAETTYTTVDFLNGESSRNQLVSLSYDTLGNYEVDPEVTSFETEIDFGYDLGLSTLANETALTVTSSTDPEITEPYLHNTLYHIANFNHITLSPFSELLSATFNEMTHDNGYRIFKITYVVEAENQTTQPYIHFIKERLLDIEIVYRNGNRVSIDNVFATREAVNSIFSLDLGVNSEIATSIYQLETQNPNQYFSYSVSGQTLTGTPYTSEDIIGISGSADVLLNINMDYTTLPGLYTFTIFYNRDGEIITLSNPLVITKNLGINAYLFDIRFSETASETSYPKIAVSDEDGTPIEGEYTPIVYFAGIDYDEADIDHIENFRIDGKVDNTPLNEYFPYFMSFLPYGASIQRKAYNRDTSEWYWTAPVNINSTEEDIAASLATDFTVYPETGEEPIESEDPEVDNSVIITYRVLSEDRTEANKMDVYYHITVIDIKYNVSLLFDVYYVFNPLQIVPVYDATSPLKNQTIVFNVKNFVTEVAIGSTRATTVSEFLTFTQILDINNDTYLFYHPYGESRRFVFGRNISGFYSFELFLPKNSAGAVIYDYYITFNGDPLPSLNEEPYSFTDLDSLYYYIETGTKNRTRRFNVYISLLETAINDDKWGLTDYYIPWEH